MSWQPTAYSLVAFGAAGVSAAVLRFAWRYRSEPAGDAFFGLVLALGGWSLAYGIQLGFGTRGAQLGAQRVALAIGGLVPTLWLLFTLQYTGREDWLTRRRLALLAIDPVAFALLAVTNPLHGLVWREAAFAPPVVVLSFAPGYYVHIAYAYLLVAAGLGLLARSLLRSSLYRTQTGLLILGALPPFAANVAFTLRLPRGALPPVDFTPIAFALTGALFGVALFRFDLLQRVPVARERLLAETDDGFAVLDAAGHVITLNPVARRLLDPSPDSDRRVRAGFPDVQFPDGEVGALDGETLTATVDGRQRTYDVARSPLTDRHGRTVGHVLEFRDVTDRHAYEQRLEVAHRVLRHNLRNRMTVIRGWAERIAATADGEHAEGARNVAETAEELIDLSEKAHTMVATAGSPTAVEPVDVDGRVASLVAAFREDHPGVTLESDVSPGARVALPDPEFLTIALTNLLENAVEHNDAADPWVRVSVEPTDTGWVRIRVADNGPGIPEEERAVIREGTETSLQHGSGLGLWLAHWIVTTAGGEITFDANEPRGSVVTFALRSDDGVT